jgi:hypothetical protein
MLLNWGCVVSGSKIRRRVLLYAVMAAALVVPFVPAGTAGAAPSVSNCWLYVPNPISISVTSPTPGQTVTVSGKAGASETVAIQIGQTGRTAVVSTTATTDSGGNYTKSVTIPASAPFGVYSVTVNSPFCGVGTLTINVRYPDNRCTDYRQATATRPFSSTWQLLGIFNWSQNVSVKLVKESAPGAGTTYTIRPAALASPNLIFNYATSNAWAPGWYTVTETGRSPIAPVARVASCGRVLIN